MFRHENGPRSPFTPGSIASSGTMTSSIMIMPVADARSENLPSIFGALSPFIPRSRMNPRMSPASSFAHTTSTSASGELVIQVFDPFSTYPPSTRFARERIDAGSDPASGSVSPKQPTHSPLRSLGRYFCRCASEPKSQIGYITSDDCTENAER